MLVGSRSIDEKTVSIMLDRIIILSIISGDIGIKQRLRYYGDVDNIKEKNNGNR